MQSEIYFQFHRSRNLNSGRTLAGQRCESLFFFFLTPVTPAVAEDPFFAQCPESRNEIGSEALK